ncbi:MAG: ABC transporter ATP-binding protein [Clostridia bacterium]|nr:ABC transporter ATP-binding protein [Clostridia bacterium]
MAENLRESPVIRAEHLKKYFPTDKEFLRKSSRVLKAVDDVSLSIEKGEIMGIVGESGCGKSTLGRVLLNLTPATDGKLFFQGDDITGLNPRAMKPYRPRMQMIFQNPFASFNPKQRIARALWEVGRVHGMSADAARARIGELMDMVHLPLEMLERSPAELSGGQLQRLAIARALVLNPDFIVADEPVSALDVSVQAQILNLIMELRARLHMTMLFISHEMTVVEHICDRVAVMYLGRIVETGPTEALFSNLMHPYAQALVSAIPRADPDEVKARIVLEGDIPSAIDLPAGCRFSSRCPRCTEECLRSEPELVDTGHGHLVACHHI